MNARKQDTRNKIALGGLVVKSGLSEEETAVVLGALVLASNALKGPKSEATRARFKAAGDAAFSVKEESDNDAKG